MLRLQSPLPERTPPRPPTSSRHGSRAAKAALGDRLFILGHHYQRDEVMRWADARGDSFRLSVLAQQRPEAEYIVFCGVHFMAESADVLTGDHQQVILPDLNAGCSMADMADIDEVEEAWEALERRHRHRPGRADHLHELVGRAEGVRRPQRRRGVHLDQRPGRSSSGRLEPRAHKVLFFPDQHLGRNTGLAMGYDPRRHAGLEPAARPRRPHRGRLQGRHLPAVEGPLLGAPAVPARARRRRSGPSTPTASSSPTPSAATTVCELADQVGSTDFIIKAVEAAPAGVGASPSAPRSTSCSGWPTRRPTRPSCRSTR